MKTLYRLAVAGACLFAAGMAAAQSPSCEDLQAAEEQSVTDQQAKCVEKLAKHGCDTSACGVDGGPGDGDVNPACAVHEATQEEKVVKVADQCADALADAGCDVSVCEPGGGEDPPGGVECAHDPLEEGPPDLPLDPACDEIVACVCALDDFCCTFDWDVTCAAGYFCMLTSGGCDFVGLCVFPF